MKRTYSIAAILCLVLVLGILGFGYNQKMKESDQKMISVQGEAKKEDFFYLADLNGYVVVYEDDQQTIYEYTNISIGDLPQDLRDEILNYKKVESMQELYGFLENYSS